MSEELKPCPFCGKPVSGPWCHTELCGTVVFQNAEMWNARPIENALRAELEAARADKTDLDAVVAQNETLDKVMGELAEANHLQEKMTAERDTAIEEIHVLNENLNIAFERIIQFENDSRELISVRDAYIKKLKKELTERDDRIDDIETALQKIAGWSDAYPLDIFPMPDWEKVDQILKAGGQSLDCVSAANMRHVVEGVGKIAKDTLK